MLYALVYHTLSGAARNMLGGVVCQNKARSTRLRFRTLPMHPTSQLKRPGGVATALWASAVSHPHTVLSRLSEPSGGGLVCGAGSRWCCHLLGTSSYDPYAAYVSGRYAAEARGGLREPRSDPTGATPGRVGKGLSKSVKTEILVI